VLTKETIMRVVKQDFNNSTNIDVLSCSLPEELNHPQDMNAGARASKKHIIIMFNE
jgi:hypothetical protein